MLGVWVVVGWSLSPQSPLAQSPWIRLVGRNIPGITATGLEVAVSYKTCTIPADILNQRRQLSPGTKPD